MTGQVDPTLDFRAPGDEVKREEARQAAYATLFKSPLGRMVLTDMLQEAGACAKSGPPGGAPGTAEYLAGMRDAVLGIAEVAGFAPAEIATAIITQGEEGIYHDRRDGFPDE